MGGDLRGENQSPRARDREAKGVKPQKEQLSQAQSDLSERRDQIAALEKKLQKEQDKALLAANTFENEAHQLRFRHQQESQQLELKHQREIPRPQAHL